jgi:hypothetical protein
MLHCVQHDAFLPFLIQKQGDYLKLRRLQVLEVPVLAHALLEALGFEYGG